jgi:hypothetical protein
MRQPKVTAIAEMIWMMMAPLMGAEDAGQRQDLIASALKKVDRNSARDHADQERLTDGPAYHCSYKEQPDGVDAAQDYQANTQYQCAKGH